jgi:DNA-binding NarL/FixJ family response regulator
MIATVYGRDPMGQTTNSDRRLTVLIADDHEVFRFGLGEVLKSKLGAKRIVEAAHLDEALERLADSDIDLAIFDLDMPGVERPSDLKAVRRQHPDVRLVVLSGSDDRADILASLEAGAHGYIIKNQRTEMLVERIKYILSGEVYVPPILAELGGLAPVAAANEDSAADPLKALTPRQSEVLELLAKGLSNKQIGLELEVSEGTAKMHVAAVLRATGAANRTEAALIGQSLIT